MTSAGKELLRAAKASAAPGQPTLSLAIGRPVVGLLRPVSTRPGQTSPADVRVLTDWRNRHVKSFLTEFEASEARTERWLVESVGPDDTRILFMVEDATGRTVGYIGLAFVDWASGYAEFDAMVRGAEAPRGLMSRSFWTISSWARSALGLESLWARARSDNPALAFMKTLGLREHRRVPLRREEGGGEVRWVEDPTMEAGGLTLVHMKLEDDGGG